MEDRGATFFELSVAFLLGAVIGAGVALMFAPAPGIETRKRLAEVGGKAIETGKKLVEESKEKVTKAAETAKTRLKKKTSEKA